MKRKGFLVMQHQAVKTLIVFCKINNITSGRLALGHKSQINLTKPGDKQLCYVPAEVRREAARCTLHCGLPQCSWHSVIPVCWFACARWQVGIIISWSWTRRLPWTAIANHASCTYFMLTPRAIPRGRHLFFKGFYIVPKEKLVRFPIFSHFKLSFQASIDERKENKLSHQIQQMIHKINFSCYKNRLKVS